MLIVGRAGAAALGAGESALPAGRSIVIYLLGFALLGNRPVGPSTLEEALVDRVVVYLACGVLVLSLGTVARNRIDPTCGGSAGVLAGWLAGRPACAPVGRRREGVGQPLAARTAAFHPLSHLRTSHEAIYSTKNQHLPDVLSPQR